MAQSLQELIARRSELLAELERVKAAIAAFADGTPVEVSTRRNIRNTGGITNDPSRANEMLVVFADMSLTTPASSAAQSGWVVRAAWEAFKLENPDHRDWIWEIEPW